MMETKTIFLVAAWDLCYKHSPKTAVKRNLWQLLPDDLSQFVGDVELRPSSISVLVRMPHEEEMDLHRVKKPEWYLRPDFVAVEFTFAWPATVIETATENAQGRGVRGKVLKTAIGRRLANTGTSIAQRISLLMNLAAPGYSSSRFAIQVAVNLPAEIAGACHSWFNMAIDDTLMQPNSPLLDIHPGPCLQWGRSVGGLWRGLPHTNVDRAFCYFTHIFSSDFNRNPFDTVVWAIGALDAFYCDTSVGLSEKLKKRIPLIIDDISEKTINKAVNSIYADRSRIIHGDISFVSNFFDPYHEAEYSASHMDLFSSIPTLYYLLLRSFRRAVEVGGHDIRFLETAVCTEA